jgi:hypothetical protein
MQGNENGHDEIVRNYTAQSYDTLATSIKLLQFQVDRSLSRTSMKLASGNQDSVGLRRWRRRAGVPGGGNGGDGRQEASGAEKSK